MDKLLSGKPIDVCALRETQIDFIYVSVRGETAQVISDRMGLVCDVAIEHDATIHGLISGIVVIAYGLFPSEHDRVKSRFDFCDSLRLKLNENVKAVHGKSSGHFGNIGSSKYCLFSFIAPGFLDALAVLAALPYGEVCELKDK